MHKYIDPSSVKHRIRIALLEGEDGELEIWVSFKKHGGKYQPVGRVWEDDVIGAVAELDTAESNEVFRVNNPDRFGAACEAVGLFLRNKKSV